MPAPCVKPGGCVALAADGAVFCAAHRREVSQADMRWLRWALWTPRLTDCRLRLVRRDPPPWWERPFHEDHYDA